MFLHEPEAELVFLVVVEIIDIYFFFLAEDGIRVHCVTGVQTCALPISRRGGWGLPGGGCAGGTPPPGPRRGSPSRSLAARRSEERRVGKECRSRGWPHG